MSTEHGLTKLGTIRDHCDTLMSRIVYLQTRIDQRTAAGVRDDANDYDRAELRAIAFALPLMETEWDNTARLMRDVIWPTVGHGPDNGTPSVRPDPSRVPELLDALERALADAREAAALARPVANHPPAATYL